MLLLAHWPTAIRKAVTQHFVTAATTESPEIKLFVGEDKRIIDQHQRWSELKLFGPFFDAEADNRDVSVRLQVHIECAISVERGENIYDITTMAGVFAQACSVGIPIFDITDPQFCINAYNVRVIERGVSEIKLPLKLAYVEADYKGVIEEERVIGQ